MTQAQVFIEHQSLLHLIALRILKCQADAEDAVHDAFEKWLRVEGSKIQNAKAYLIFMVRNISLNRIKGTDSANTESLEIDSETCELHAVEQDHRHFDLDIDIRKALSIITHKLEPLERVVVMLKEVFNFDYESLTKIVGKKAENCRQILCRAKRKLDKTAAGELTSCKVGSLAEAFRKSCNSGNFRELLRHLMSDFAGK